MYKDYYIVLQELHSLIRPRGYLEVGISGGDSLALTDPGTRCVAIDPDPKLIGGAPHMRIARMTSDAYFEEHDLAEDLDGSSLDLVFIDGMHLFEYALRDFGNAEVYANERTVFVVHDCDPVDAVVSSRERTIAKWTGDVWKLAFCLAEHRPELTMSVLDVAPSGLLVVTGVTPGSRALLEISPDVVEEYVSFGYDYYEAHRKLTDGLVRSFPEVVKRHGLVPAHT